VIYITNAVLAVVWQSHWQSHQMLGHGSDQLDSLVLQPHTVVKENAPEHPCKKSKIIPVHCAYKPAVSDLFLRTPWEPNSPCRATTTHGGFLSPEDTRKRHLRFHYACDHSTYILRQPRKQEAKQNARPQHAKLTHSTPMTNASFAMSFVEFQAPRTSHFFINSLRWWPGGIIRSEML
jgi:hypothetical protein